MSEASRWKPDDTRFSLTEAAGSTLGRRTEPTVSTYSPFFQSGIRQLREAKTVRQGAKTRNRTPRPDVAFPSEFCPDPDGEFSL
jgi:hypothetical protein